MSEENGLIYCPQCGGENPSTYKFCSNCGAKLEMPKAYSMQETNDSEPVQETNVSEPVQQVDIPETPVYEKVEAEVVNDSNATFPQEELHINYGAEEGVQVLVNQMVPGGNSGFAIASMVCGIISLLCCCLTWFSLILGIAAVVLGVITLKNNYSGKGMAIAGIITGGIGIFIWLICLLIGGLDLFSGINEEFDF